MRGGELERPGFDTTLGPRLERASPEAHLAHIGSPGSNRSIPRRLREQQAFCAGARLWGARGAVESRTPVARSVRREPGGARREKTRGTRAWEKPPTRSLGVLGPQVDAIAVFMKEETKWRVASRSR